MLDGLEFLPIADLTEGIAYIRSVIPEEPAETGELVDYFETTYVTSTYRAAPSIWSVHSATVDIDPRTNNVCEGWNSKLFNLSR